MKSAVIPSHALNSLSLSPEKHIQAFQATYERRLMRLYRCHYLPHQICEWLDITFKQFGDDIKRLHEAGNVLSVDNRTETDFMSMPAPSTLSKAKFERLLEDNQFYHQQNIPMAERARLLMLTRSRLRDLPQPSTAKRSIDNTERDKAIALAFEQERHVRGIKSKLAKTWGISRKAIDLILEKQGINPLTTKPKTPAKRHSKAPMIISQFKTLEDTGLSRAEIRRHLAQQHKCSISYVIKVLGTLN